MVTMTKTWQEREKMKTAKKGETPTRQLAIRAVQFPVRGRPGRDSVEIAEWYDPQTGEIMGYTAIPWVYKEWEDKSGHVQRLLSIDCWAGDKKSPRRLFRT